MPGVGGRRQVGGHLTTAPLERVPDDVLHLILEQVYAIGEPSLRNAALVSHRFYRIAVPILSRVAYLGLKKSSISVAIPCFIREIVISSYAPLCIAEARVLISRLPCLDKVTIEGTSSAFNDILEYVHDRFPRAKLHISRTCSDLITDTGITTSGPALHSLALTDNCCLRQEGKRESLRKTIVSSPDLKRIQGMQVDHDDLFVHNSPWNVETVLPGEKLPHVEELINAPIKLAPWAAAGALQMLKVLEVYDTTDLYHLAGVVPNLRELTIHNDNKYRMHDQARWQRLGPLRKIVLPSHRNRNIPVTFLGYYGETLVDLVFIRRPSVRQSYINIIGTEMSRLIKLCPKLQNLTIDLFQREVPYLEWPLELLSNINSARELTKLTLKIDQWYSDDIIECQRLKLNPATVASLFKFFQDNKGGEALRTLRVDHIRSNKRACTRTLPSFACVASPGGEPSVFAVPAEPWIRNVRPWYCYIHCLSKPYPSPTNLLQLRRLYECDKDDLTVSHRPRGPPHIGPIETVGTDLGTAAWHGRLAHRLGVTWAETELLATGLMDRREYDCPGATTEWYGARVNFMFPVTGTGRDALRGMLLRELKAINWARQNGIERTLFEALYLQPESKKDENSAKKVVPKKRKLESAAVRKGKKIAKRGGE